MTKEEFTAEALKYLDYPAMKYREPKIGQDVKGFDCSGFITFLLQTINFPAPIPRHCNEYFDSFGMFVHKFQIGDLVFFSLKNGGVYPDHMGIVTSESEYVHSPGKDDTLIKSSALEWKNIKPLAGQVNDQIYTLNPIGFKRLTVKEGRYQQVFFT